LLQTSMAQMVISETWPEAYGYGPWIEEVWLNYISNAVKYGGNPPRLELGATSLPQGRVRFWVRDNGQGLSKDEQSQLFTAFTRLQQTSVEGHGLGLSIVQRIVTKLKGEVGVNSTVGYGSEFFFTLPSVLSDDDQAAS
jgi:two-component system sensor histidine kinase/response regulator